MTSRRWIVWTLLLTLAVGGGAVGLNVWLDIYGLFRDARGRSLPIYGSEYRAKYFLSLHYVPQNFNGIVLGSSVSDNWRVQDIESFRFYNESTDGGNITAQKILAERALRSPGVVAAICVIHPYMTHTQGLIVPDMSEDEYRGAFGSLSLFQTYPHLVMVKLGRESPRFDAFGSQEVPAPFEMNEALRTVMLPEGEIHVEEAAFQEYREIVATFHQKGLFVAAVVPPSSEAILDQKRAEMGRFVARMRTLFAPSDPFIDFTTPEHEGFRRDPANFKDGVHLTPEGAAKLVRVLNTHLADKASHR